MKFVYGQKHVHGAVENPKEVMHSDLVAVHGQR